MKSKKIFAIATLVGVLTVGGTTAFAASGNQQAQATASSKINTDKSGNAIDEKGNIVITKDELNDPANASGHISASGSTSLIGKVDDSNNTSSEASAQLNTDENGNVIDDKGNIVITKDELNDPANASGYISASADIAN